MRQVKSIFSILIVLVSLCCIDAKAQNTQIITPTNAAASALEIKNLFGNLIDVSAQEIENFYLDRWGNATFSNNCVHPEASVLNMNNDDVTFKWNAIPFANDYVVSYLKLSDGTSQSFSTSTSSMTLDIPLDLYLITFQSQCGGKKSALDIIIVERPINFEGKNCDCERYKKIWEADFGPTIITTPTYPWAPSYPFERYLCKVSFDPTDEYPDGINASFRAEIAFDDNTPQTIFTYRTCMKNVDFSADGEFIYAHIPDDPSQSLGVFGFVQNPNNTSTIPVFSFGYSLDAPSQSGHIALYQCRDRRLRSSSTPDDEVYDQLSLKEASHSFDPNKIIEYNLPLEGNVSLLLFDTQGRLLKTIIDQDSKEAGLHRQALNLTGFSGGLFICLLKTETETLPLKLLKTQ